MYWDIFPLLPRLYRPDVCTIQLCWSVSFRYLSVSLPGRSTDRPSLSDGLDNLLEPGILVNIG
jgi:hypothetical protein